MLLLVSKLDDFKIIENKFVTKTDNLFFTTVLKFWERYDNFNDGKK